MHKQTGKLLGLFCALAMPACTLISPEVSKRSIRTMPPSASASLKEELPMPALNCRLALEKEQELKRSVVEQLADQGDWYAALAQVDTLPAQSVEVALLKADILRQLDPVMAERWYKALITGCQSVRAEHGLALIAAARGQYAEALPRMQLAARKYPDDPRIRNDLGVLYLYLQSDTRAAFELRTAHELAKDDAQPRFNLMLLALLQANRQAWFDFSNRWQPVAAVRGELNAMCIKLLSQRAKAGHLGSCPIDPRA